MKVGILGGTFNPPHLEHLNMAKEALRSGLDKVVFVPSNNPPHKNCMVDFDTRVDMLELALDGEQCFEICPIEGINNDVHYSYVTIPTLKKIYGDISFIIGGDSMIDFCTWKNPDKIIKMCPIIVFGRGHRQQELDNAIEFWRGKGAQITLMQYQAEDISSSIIRYMLACGHYEGIAEKVVEYIKSNNLYSDFAFYVDNLKKNVLEPTFEHIVRTCECALRLNESCNLKLESDKVFLSALLHDSAKKVSHEPHDVKDIPKLAVGTAVEHQFLGAILAETVYNIKDKEIVDAIRFHCTGRANMTTLEKLIFCADMLEKARDFDGVDYLRQEISKDFEQGFRQCVFHQNEYLIKNNMDIYPLTTESADYYKEH